MFFVCYYRDLNLAGNPIARLKDASFQHVSQLVKLDLSRCQLVHIEDQAFAHLQILETLKLNSNNLTLLNNATVSQTFTHLSDPMEYFLILNLH